MSVKDSYNKRITFDTCNGLEDKSDKLTALMDKLVARDSEVNRPFKPQIYQSKRRGQGRNFMIHTTMTEETIKIGADQIVVIGGSSSVDKVEVG